MNSILFAVLFLFVIASAQNYHRCPRKESLQPCQCDDSIQEIVCRKNINNPINIRYIFQESIPEFDEEESSKPFRYVQLIIENLPIERLVNKSFENFVFDYVLVKNNYYLSNLEPDVFEPTQLITKTLKFDSNPNLFTESIENVFYVISKFVSLEMLEIHKCQLTYLPSDPFLEQINLKRIILTENQLKIVPPKLFSHLPSLRVLDLSKNQIQKLPRSSLKLNSSSFECHDRHESIFIELNDNNLTEDSFENGTIETDCSLEIKLTNNSIVYLDESIFKPLFKRYVKIVIYDNPLECQHCQMKWLHRGRFCSGYNQTLHYYSAIESLCEFRNQFDFRHCKNEEEKFQEINPELLKCPPIPENFSVKNVVSPVVIIIMLVILKFT